MTTPVATHELSDVRVSKITVVKAGANRKRWFLRKSDEQGAPATEIGDAPAPLLKAADDWSTAYVVVAEPGWVEHGGQGAEGVADVWKSTKAIEEAAHAYLADGASVNRLVHGSPEDPVLKVVESAVALADFDVDGTTIAKGSWYVGLALDADAREMVEKGEITGVSIEGTGLRTEVAKAAPSERSVMVALYPPADVANALAITGGEHPADLHLTLAYLGDIADDRLHLVAEAVESAVRRMDTHGLTGEIAGAGTFVGGPKPVHYASVDAPSLPELRQKVVEALSDHGVPARADHGFTPHITLKFGRGATPRVDTQPVRFEAVHIVRGDRDVASVPMRPQNPDAPVLAKAGRLDRSPKKNWVENAGGLPKYIEDIALALERGGKKLEQAIPIAISRVKRWAAGLDGVSPAVKAKAAKALAEWEALKARNKTTSKVQKMLERLRKLADPKTKPEDLDAEDHALIAKILGEEEAHRSGEPASTIGKTEPKKDEGTEMDETKLAEALAKAMEPTLTKVNDRLDAVEKALEAKPAAPAKDEPKADAASIEKSLDDLTESFVESFQGIQKQLDALSAGGSTQPQTAAEPVKKAAADPMAGIL